MWEQVGVTAAAVRGPCGGTRDVAPAVAPQCPCCVPVLGLGCGSASAHRDSGMGL